MSQCEQILDALKRGPLTLLPPLVTHLEDGSARTAAAQAIVEGLAIGW